MAGKARKQFRTFSFFLYNPFLPCNTDPFYTKLSSNNCFLGHNVEWIFSSVNGYLISLLPGTINPFLFSAQISFRRIEVVLCKERSSTVNSPVVVFLLNSVLDVNLIYTLSDYNSFKLEQMDFQSLAKLKS